ncbi:hypothetical protein ACFOWX_13310, partial [Sphingorhabdus arenilitoris]
AFNFLADFGSLKPTANLAQKHGFYGEVGFDWGWCNIGWAIHFGIFDLVVAWRVWVCNVVAGV